MEKENNFFNGTAEYLSYPYLTPLTNVSSKGIKTLNTGAKSTNILEENIDIYLPLRAEDSCLSMTPKV